MCALQKLEIRAYKDPKLLKKSTLPTATQEEKDAGTPYSVYINPEKYSLNYKAEYTIEDATGSSGGTLKYHRSLPEDLELELLFDRTGVLEDSPFTPNGIIDDIDTLRKHVFDYNGETHRPLYLKVTWGSLLFPGVVTDLSIDYKLFKDDGTPIRATVKVTFKNFIEEEARAKRENKNSPDLTHQRMVKEGDNLSNLCEEIYGDPKYYVEVAKANKLTNFRKLTPGTSLMFPPLEKQTQE